MTQPTPTNRASLLPLLNCPQLLQAAEQCESLDQPATIMRLRKIASAGLVAQAIELVAARRRAAGKLPLAGRLLLDRVGVEQASSAAVADVKAERYAAVDVKHVIDLCCGIGGDAMALARHLPDGAVTLIDRDLRKVAMARHNVRVATGRACPAACADVTTLPLHDAVFHLDPARRTVGGRRTHAYADYQPGPAFIDELLSRCQTGAIKLGPGVDIEQLPLAGRRELQFISQTGHLVQAVLWTGALASSHASRSATVISSTGDIATLTGTGDEPVTYAPIGRFLGAIDSAVERAGLIGVLSGQLRADAVHPKLGLLTADQPMVSPFVTCFEHLATLPVRKVGAWLAEHDGGLVEVKTRGKAADPDQLQTQWRGNGDMAYTVFVLRHDQVVKAHVTRRL